MKKTVVYILLTGIILALSCCKQQDSIYEEFIVPNGLAYPGKVLNPITYPGKERIEITWQNGTDPEVVKARIAWNNNTEWEELTVNPNTFTIRHIIDPISENTYSFMIRTYDAKGNISVPVEVMGVVYGEMYERSLVNIPIIETSIDATGTLNIQFISTPPDIVATEIKYAEATTGDTVVVRTPISAESAQCPLYKIGSNFYTRTLYMPDTLCLDTFCTAYKEQDALYLQNRNIEKTTVTASALRIHWSEIDFSSSIAAMEVQYTDVSGTLQTVEIDAGTTIGEYPNYKHGSSFRYRTKHIMSDNSFYTEYEEQNGPVEISKLDWEATSDSFQEVAEGNLRASADKAIDDNINTFWHTQYSPVADQYPHWLAVDMKEPIAVGRIELFRRPGNNELFSDFVVQSSGDGVTWTDIGSFTFRTVDGPQSYTIEGAPVMRHIRIYIASASIFYAHLAEFTAYTVTSE